MKRQWYATPYALWMLIFTIVPLLFVIYYAFTNGQGAFTTANIAKIFQPGYMSTLFESLKLAFFCTIICLLVGYPTAYFLASRDFSANKMLVVLILLPMWMNFLLRTYAMMTLLEDNGLINTLLQKIGIGPLTMIGTEGAVLLGMVYNFLPFMVLPIYTALKKLDAGVIEAAEDLGANPMRVITRVIVPQSIPGVVSGITMVFIPAVTTFAISRLLSSGNIYLMGDMIEEYFITTNNRNLGSSMSLIMLALVLISTVLLRRLNPEREGDGK
ncbi:MAG: ABC transporter permease [Clostridia bacterium]|nr:ABC transporter permease [Clostridia bacterium]